MGLFQDMSAKYIETPTTGDIWSSLNQNYKERFKESRKLADCHYPYTQSSIFSITAEFDSFRDTC